MYYRKILYSYIFDRICNPLGISLRTIKSRGTYIFILKQVVEDIASIEWEKACWNY